MNQILIKFTYDIYMEEYDPNKKRKKLIVFANGISFKLSNKKFNPLVTESFIKGKKIRKSLLFLLRNLILLSPKTLD